MGRSFRFAAGLGVSLVLAMGTWPASADVTLVSQEARSGSGDWAIRPLGLTDPTYNWDHPTTWTTSTNFTTLGPAGGGLQLNLTRSGSTSKNIGPPAGTGARFAKKCQAFACSSPGRSRLN